MDVIKKLNLQQFCGCKIEENEKDEAKERRLLALSLGRDSKYTLDSTLPIMASRDLREDTRNNAQKLNKKVDAFSETRDNKKSNDRQIMLDISSFDRA